MSIYQTLTKISNKFAKPAVTMAKYKDVNVAKDIRGGRHYIIFHKGEKAGKISVSLGQPMFSTSTHLDSYFRKQGIANHAYDRIEKQTNQRMHPSPVSLTDNAEKLWKKRMQRYSPAERHDMIERVKQHGHDMHLYSAETYKKLDNLK